ncbi:hypothetical protein [Rheinheimera sp.]|uniref:hypothetical protein n=1 Tax=Rheinheimera sp. TaxID=1869214 RepID=UPI00262A7123|nr:hypothetical protein [Rheinheimera sp.]MCA1931603.1 hypothetical protein [Rheinheimera sp.]
MAKIVDLNDEWALNIGKVFLSFGSLEKFTVDCISKWLDGQRIVYHLTNAPLAQRINIVIDLAKDKYGDREEVQSFSKNLNKLLELAKKRNLIAHNPLMMVLYEDSFKEEICSLKDENKAITLSDLISLVSEVEGLYSELHYDLVQFHLIDDPDYLSAFKNKKLTGLLDTRGNGD